MSMYGIYYIKEETLMLKKNKGFCLVANNEEQKVQD